jgi:hypothetical protein
LILFENEQEFSARPSLKNSLFAVADPHFLEWVGRRFFVCFFFIMFIESWKENKNKLKSQFIYL